MKGFEFGALLGRDDNIEVAAHGLLLPRRQRYARKSFQHLIGSAVCPDSKHLMTIVLPYAVLCMTQCDGANARACPKEG